MPALLCRLFLAVLLLLPALTSAHAEEGRWRDRLRERIEERREERRAAHETGNDQSSNASHTLGIGGEQRHYRVYRPRSYRSGTAMPLVIALHGGGGDMNHMARDELYGLISAADSHGFVLAIPNGSSRLPSGKLATWNAGHCCGNARDSNADDVGFIRALIAELSRQNNIDRDRIFAIGMSNGGMMAYRLACDAADLFRGIMAVAGTDNSITCTPARPVAVLHIHARDDDHVLFQGGAGANAFRDRSKVTDFTSVPATISKWVALNHANPTARTILSVAGAQCSRHDGPAPVQLCVTDTGGHSWPGGNKPRGAAPSQAIQANSVMWAFFAGL